MDDEISDDLYEIVKLVRNNNFEGVKKYIYGHHIFELARKRTRREVVEEIGKQLDETIVECTNSFPEENLVSWKKGPMKKHKAILVTGKKKIDDRGFVISLEDL